MSVIKVATNFNIDIEMPVAPFHKRLAAWIIDVVVLLLYVYFTSKFISYLSGSASFLPGEGENVMVVVLIVIPVFTYHLICEVLTNGRSIGKRIMNLRVVTETGSRPGLSQFLIRWFIRTSDYMAIVIILYAPTAIRQDPLFFWKMSAAFILLIIDLVLVNTTIKNQRLGDILAHTMLISTQQTGAFADTIYLEVREDHVPLYPEVMKLSDQNINTLKEIISAIRKQNDYDLAERTAEKIKNHLQITTTLPAAEFLERLLKDYNYISSN
jgi:uncharacterized RDD family membrane protein YckC